MPCMAHHLKGRLLLLCFVSAASASKILFCQPASLRPGDLLKILSHEESKRALTPACSSLITLDAGECHGSKHRIPNNC